MVGGRVGAWLTGVACAMVAGMTGAARADVFSVSYEAAGVTQANAAALCSGGGCTLGTESFDSRPLGTSSFDADFGTGRAITGTYGGVTINTADQFGGAGHAGQYAVTFGTSYTLDLATRVPGGVNYFGFWLSALDAGNTVAFSRGGTTLFTFAPAAVQAALGGCSGGNAYCGNPVTHEDAGEQFVFVNLFDTTGSFDRVTFTETPMVGGYESDNHTVGHVTGQSGTPVPPVPEPGTFVLLSFAAAAVAIAGLGLRRAAARA